MAESQLLVPSTDHSLLDGLVERFLWQIPVCDVNEFVQHCRAREREPVSASLGRYIRSSILSGRLLASDMMVLRVCEDRLQFWAHFAVSCTVRCRRELYLC